MSERAPLTPEMVRILRAIERGHLTFNRHGRYIIRDEPKRPERRARELLTQRRYIEWRTVFGGESGFRLTRLGEEALAVAQAPEGRDG